MQTNPISPSILSD